MKVANFYYTDFVHHCLRFYARNTDKTVFNTSVDKQNWLACDMAFKTEDELNRKILLSVYSNRDTLPDAVYETSKSIGINQNIIWDMMKSFERKVAKKRGLL